MTALKTGFAADAVRSEETFYFFLSAVHGASSQEGGREGGGSLHASSGGGKYFPLLYVCMVEIHCKKSKYVKGINVTWVGE